MSSETSIQATNRQASLQALRFKKNAKAARANGALGSDTPGLVYNSSSASPYQVPAQSRDATARPSYGGENTHIHSTGSPQHQTSVPSSSVSPAPSRPGMTYKPHQSHYFTSTPSPAQILPSLPRVQRGYDASTVPTTFQRSASSSTNPMSGVTTSDATLKRREDYEQDREQGPPRKRVNRGVAPANPIHIDSSPEATKFSSTAQKRPPPAGDSSDSDMPDATDLIAPKPTRIIRGRRETDAPKPPGQSVELKMFIMTNPQYDPTRVARAFQLCDGDEKNALGLIKDSTWSHATPSTSTSTPSRSRPETPSVSGSASKRATEKEKGKKSMIYAHRQGILSQQSTPAKPLIPRKEIITILDSPVAPKPAKRRNTKQVIASSGSEVEYSSDEEGGKDGAFTQTREDQYYYDEALKWLNECEAQELVELAGITLTQANTLISLRPFPDEGDLTSKLSRRNKTGLSSRLFENIKELFKGYKSVDDVLAGCERIGEQLREAISKWNQKPTASTSKASTPLEGEEGALALVNTLPEDTAQADSDYISKQPSILSESVVLKDYQVMGINWMYLLYRRNLSCILADEMGLGKTVQVIAFLALLKERRQEGPHLIIVPSSTLENWLREFERFAPVIEVVAYYGSQKERVSLRGEYLAQNWNVMITTYNLAQGDEKDRKFFRKFTWQCCIFDEGHVLKNFESQRYGQLMKIESKWRLLLTGTPLQNNLQELVSLMNFILPRYFTDVIENLRAIFKVKADRQISLLARDRVSRAKKMMTPFVLRRRKDMVLKDLPKKSERIEWCEMTPLQKSIYRDALKRSRKAVLEATVLQAEEEEGTEKKAKGKKSAAAKKAAKDTSSNVLMDLRKAASHPMLFRRLFDDDLVKVLAKQCMKEPEFMESNYNYIVEDMEVMTDAELQAFCLKYKSTRKFAKEGNCFEDAGKIAKLIELLDEYHEQGRRILIFSQFTQILDILQAVLKHRNMKFLVLTGSTAVDIRQSLVDEFNEDESISVFLLSTKAGGMGINLTAASVVVLFDQDFNPHNDRQAADRAYRIGQKRNVDVIKLITKSTIEEDMYRLGQTKLALDEAVAGEDVIDGDGDSKAEKKMKSSLLSVLREQFEKEEMASADASRGQSILEDIMEESVEDGEGKGSGGAKRDSDITIIE
ncbi:hypothetical protein M422DRAFT_246455 [Sphaerobolus stellatus SS14]|nr:hypothetical protein M422DRAFT_246455 [Sphaerobolus stellatus SS14]